MFDLAIISGSGFYDFPGLEDPRELRIETRFGFSAVIQGHIFERRVVFLSRHGRGHKRLPNHINHRANLAALKDLDVRALVSTTVCGVLDPAIPLAVPVIFSDLYFPDNRLPGGEPCTIHDRPGEPSRGHLIIDRPFSGDLRSQLIEAAEGGLTEGTYAQAYGPRFNTAAEIRMFRNYASFISQTAGPEVVLAGELEIPCALLGFGVDYANGVAEFPTPIHVLESHLQAGKDTFVLIIKKTLQNFQAPRFEGFNFRFE